MYMFLQKITSSNSFHLIPAQDEEKTIPSQTFRLIPAQDSKSKLIHQLQMILPDSKSFVSNFNKEKENFWIDIIENKDEFIADIASMPMLQVSPTLLLNYIENNKDEYSLSDFIKLLKEQIDVHIGMYHMITWMKWLVSSKSIDESTCSWALKKYLEWKLANDITLEELKNLKKMTDTYDQFLIDYEYLLGSKFQIDPGTHEDILSVFQNFRDEPSHIKILTLMKIEKIRDLTKKLKIPYNKKFQ